MPPTANITVHAARMKWPLGTGGSSCNDLSFLAAIFARSSASMSSVDS